MVMDSKAGISVKNARLGYKKSGKELAILSNVNLEFYPGEVIGIVGLNGTGKSTLLKSLCGLLLLLGGDILMDQQSIANFSLPELAKKIAVVLTEKIGGFNLTAYDVVVAGQMPYTDAFHRLTAGNKKIIDDAIAACGIKAHTHKLLNELSDGLFQKTIIAKALAQQTPVMLLDEPSAFLDYASKHELFLLLRQLAKNDRKCILVSSHDLDLLLKYCDRLVVISNGIVELIAVSEARQHQGFVEIGGGYIM
jgi:cobalamin transport system ATP-binding protein